MWSVIAFLASGVAMAQPPANPPSPPPGGDAEWTDAGDSQSIGNTERGSLVNAFALEASDTIAVVRPINRYGTREMVGLLQRAADAVARSLPGARLAVGDISSQTGGHLVPHESHQSGRDADVGFFVLDPQGNPVPQAIFVTIGQDGTGRRRDSGPYRFDDARNWTLLLSFVDDPMAEVQHVLIASHLRARLLEHARATGAPEDQIRRVELVTDPIRGSERHDDHFHVRIYCPVGDRPECLDRPPLHPWYDGTPSPHAVAAARAADALRAAALRRDQELQRAADAALREGQIREQVLEQLRARALEQEDARQAAAERARAARLTQQERQAIQALRRMEAEARRSVSTAARGEHVRSAALVAAERRWAAAERRRAARLRAQMRAAEARTRRAPNAAAIAQRRASSQMTADERRAAQLLRRSAQLERQRYASARRTRRTPDPEIEDDAPRD